jgi:hypothetical protein
VSVRVGAIVVPLAALAAGLWGSACGSVDLGQDVQFAQISYDQNYFYCAVEPVLFQQNCGPGDPAAGDPPNGCHYNFTSFKLTKHDPIPCTGNVPKNQAIPAEAQSNYMAAEREMTPDPEQAPLLNRPTKQVLHPRQIFKVDSTSANVIRTWATKYTTQ